MEKSIVEQVIAIAIKKEEERLKPFKEKVYQDFKENFSKRAEALKPWTAIGGKYYQFNVTKIVRYGFDRQDFIKICKDLGFDVYLSSHSDIIEISIPECTEQEKTPAQVLLEQFNVDFKKAIKAEEAIAEETCKEVLKRLCDGDFKVVDVLDNKYLLDIIVKSGRSNNYFKSKAVEIMAQNGFKLVFNTDTSWRFVIYSD